MVILPGREPCLFQRSGRQKLQLLKGCRKMVIIPFNWPGDEVDVPQCGYCQAGQIMTAAALLKRTPKPTPQQIDDAMHGNLCRCGAYHRIREAIQSASKKL